MNIHTFFFSLIRNTIKARIFSKLFVITSLLGFSMIMSPMVSARWATMADTDIIVESSSRDITVNKDGTYVETIEVSARANKESGKDKLVSLPLTYNTRNATLKILEANTIRDGVSHPVDIKHIEDKPLASSPQGFDQNNQMLIAFPEVGLDAIVHIKYQQIIKEPHVPGFFATEFTYGMGQYCKNSKARIVSELPLFLAVNDPEDYLDVKKEQSNGKYTIEIALKRPVIKAPIDEQFVAFDGKIFPWVTVSSLDNWDQLGKKMIGKYEEVLNEPLPPLFETIATAAGSKTTTTEKINTVTSKLAENLTYMGDWRTVSGAYIPRKLTEIVKSKLGDCKDFSASTVAILRKLGLKADVALVYRGLETSESPNHLPLTEDFNHAFVRVVDNDKIYWVDPTNFTSFAQGIYPDIADRKAMVLDPKNPHLSRTDKIDPQKSGVSLSKKIMLPHADPELAHVDGEVKMIGVHALGLVGADLRASKDSIDHDIIRGVADETRTIGFKVDSYNLTSRVAEDLNFKFNLTEKHTQIKTTAGNAFVVRPLGLIDKLLTKTNDRVTDLQLDIPSTYQNDILLSKASLVGKLSNCSFDSPWVQGSRTISNTAEGIRVLDQLIVKKDKISNAELKSQEYATLQNTIYGCFGDTALVYDNQK